MNTMTHTRLRALPGIFVALLRLSAALALAVGFALPSAAVPSFARQTGMACSTCHTVFPELTPFGREFKLNGYVLDNIKQIKGIDLQSRETLSLNAVPPLSVMLQVSYTHTGAALPDSAATGALARDGDVLFPQQASLFYAGKIADNAGAFMQLTYDGAEDHFGFDNTDLRYARHFNWGKGQPVQSADGLQAAAAETADSGSHTLVVGVTVNNGPTVQDVWNTTAAWGFPYSGSSTAPGPIASTKLDAGAGGLGQTAAGAGVYAWLDSSIYAEFSLYAASLPGGAHPLDSTQVSVVHGTSPYWRLAYEKRWDRNSLSVGTYGIDAKINPGNGVPLSGPTDRYRDVAADLQYQFIGEDHIFSLLSTYISEKQSLDASFAHSLATNQSNTLHSYKLTGEYYYQRNIGGSIGFFDITGSSDANLYAPAPATGSLNNSPNSRGETFEVNYLPWLNAKLQLQYTVYSQFNGASTNYDGAGRNASDNNTLYLLIWLNY
jgi:hypothetical protein